MDYLKIGLGNLSSIVVGVDISDWGHKLTLMCVYNPNSKHIPYKIVFCECSQINWEIIDKEKNTEDSVELIDIRFGDNYLSPALINTNAFEIIIWHDYYHIEIFN